MSRELFEKIIRWAARTETQDGIDSGALLDLLEECGADRDLAAQWWADEKRKQRADYTERHARISPVVWEALPDDHDHLRSLARKIPREG